MKLMAFNGSPRKKWNTATMIEHALEGAREAGAEVELIHLYDLDFKGCSSCFACKRLGRKEVGVCTVKDDLKPILERVREADALLVGTPVYFGTESACTRAFLERVQFPYLNYADYSRSHFPRKIPTALIYTMNVTESMLKDLNYPVVFERARNFMGLHFGSCELLLSTNTSQYKDYDKYETGFNKDDKARQHAEQFPKDCQAAKELGARLAQGYQA
ncbi:2-amino-4-deoxychorismate dehydrogenase [Pseudodesulfovibrio hydrargyri]|uniref:2-amino-4-deoxychorismate dehydrogenase n=1 Tax=Pseudodesulfovibrio hydrargyri TaxID=2125990 RepID=A0A1J5NET8_9BACT|nr:flavodoxin family protein [Pseudodesulfovibrio hydrargyri]OIQ50241.1 2-amino-4-deoxychorismate dehydrogenase [Pseudodesulfovibrio hydrargyri]